MAPERSWSSRRPVRLPSGTRPPYPTTRRLGATPQHRAADLARSAPKPFLGHSDNTNLLNWLWTHCIAGFCGGSTQVHLGPGPGVDPIHAASLRAALLTGERLEITEPGESEDFGKDWLDPAALTEHGDREPTEPWTWAGPERSVTGRTWGGCIEVIEWILTAGRFPADPTVLQGGVLLLEGSELLTPAREFGWILRSLGERGLLDTVDAVIVVGVPFGHTRPQWVLPHCGSMTVDGAEQRVWADHA